MKCEKCGIREATQIWSTDEMSFIHGISLMWCEYCVVKSQLEYAEKQRDRIPELLNRLFNLEVKENDQLQRN
jgi:hypothetical protein